MEEEKRKCINCGNEIYKFIDICPFCKTDNSNAKEVESKQDEEELRANIRNDEEFSLKICDSTSEEMNKYKKEADEMVKGFFVATPICIVIGTIFSVLICLIINGMLNAKTMPDMMAISEVIIILLFFSFIAGACIWAPINELFKTTKYKSLVKNGILIKNLPYEVLKSKESYNKHRHILVKAVYKDENGKELTFRGNITDDILDKHDVCDVIYDPKKPKKYIMQGYYYFKDVNIKK